MSLATAAETIRKRWFNGPRSKKLRKVVSTPKFGKAYAVASVLVVLVTTLFWSLLGAKLQQGNADQLSNTDLFENLRTFHAATFPSTHTFLLKWPLFLLIKLFGSSGTAITVFTVAAVLLTVACLVAVLYRLERRPLVFGTLCLALASVLLLVPAQPYPGGILPVNMAMLATRNLEYVLYIISLVLLIRSPRVKSWGFWLAVGCLSLLIASDKLFLVLGVGGALIGLIVYARSRNWGLVSFSVNWLSLAIIAAIGASAILALLSGSHITHLSSQSGASPYSLSSKASGLVLGSIYAILGLFTNFGANPAFDSTVVRHIPHQLYVRLTSLGGPAYAINALILIFGLYIIYVSLRGNLVGKRAQKTPISTGSGLSTMLIWSTVAALASFVVTNHYYAVDARYLTISLFAVFISIAAYTRRKKWHPELVVYTGAIITIGIALGLATATRTYNGDKSALDSQNARNSIIAQVLAHHHVDTLVGDYWRVLPTRLDANNQLTVTPLTTCNQARDILSSKAWQLDLRRHSFAYLLTLDGNLTDYPNCTLKQAIANYGHPDSSTLIAGRLSQPKELLLFYDSGIHRSSPKTNQSAQGPATVLPITLDQLPYTTCDSLSTMNIVAHEDDDLLFMNPDVINTIKAGHCVRTIYVTAGDAGNGKFYWLGREQGSEAAYAYMLGLHDIWIQRIVELSSHEFITVANPRGNSKISLIFMHLPDGNLKGEGFGFSHYESLSKLQAGKISQINAVDGQSSYTGDQLSTALATLMGTYKATEINTQAGFLSTAYPDHSDHIAVGQYVKRAYKLYEHQQYADQVTIPIKFYIGYPVHQRSANLSGGDLQAKEATFLNYAKFDGAVCQTLEKCQQVSTYNAYLTREYQNAY